MTEPPAWVAPENDHRGILRLPAVAEPSTAVVIPAYNRAEALALTLAGLCNQTIAPDAVVVADDGSSEDLAATVSRFDGRLPVALHRQERDGFGLARARNLGAGATAADVIIFVDADCIPAPTLVERHRFWHARAANLLVAGSRINVQVAGIGVGDIETGAVDLSALDQVGEVVEVGDPPADWRRTVYRRSAGLTLGDAGFRAAVGANISVRRSRFVECGGFDPAFRAWGGEDTEFAWRVWNNGAFVVPDNSAVCYHQIEPGEDRSWRAGARQATIALVADRVPHRFYRPAPTPFATVPKLSWIVSTSDATRASLAWRRLSSAFADAEVIFWGSPDALSSFAVLEGEASRVRVVDDPGPSGFEAALAVARGEVVAMMDDRVEFSKGLTEKALRRLDGDRRAGGLRVPYRIEGKDLYRRFDDLTAIDRVAGAWGTPVVGFMKRRALMKDRESSPGARWTEAFARERTLLLPGDPIELPDIGSVGTSRSMSPTELVASGRELARLAVRRARGLADGVAEPPAPRRPTQRGEESVTRIDYVGFTEHHNLGDDAILVGLRRAMPWASLQRDHAEAGVLMLGGGTLVNGGRYYLNRVLKNDSPAMERVVAGVGVRDPEFHGITEPVEEWWRFFDSSVYTGVRGPDSIAALRRLGYRGEVDVFGDPALLLEAPPEVARIRGRVVICPVWTSGNLMGGDDSEVFSALASTIGHLHADGREVVVMSAFPQDDRYIIDLMRAAGLPEMPYVAGYDDVDAALALLASAGLVVAERLHAAILAAAVGTPFVGLEYWPKHRDFARSLDLEECIVPTAGLTGTQLWEAVSAISVRSDDITARMNDAVGHMRSAQLRKLGDIKSALGGA